MQSASSKRTTLARLWRDRLSAVAACLFAFILVASFAGGPISSNLLGHNGFDQFPYASNIDR